GRRHRAGSRGVLHHHDNPAQRAARLPGGQSMKRADFAPAFAAAALGILLTTAAYAQAQDTSLPITRVANETERCAPQPCVEKDSSGPHILTALGPVFAVTEPLLADTAFEVGMVPASGPRTLQAQLNLLTRQADDFLE